MNTIELGKAMSIEDADILWETFFEQKMAAINDFKSDGDSSDQSIEWIKGSMRALRLEKKLYNELLNIREKKWIVILSTNDKKIIYLLPLLHAITVVQPDLNVVFREKRKDINQTSSNNPALLLILNDENKVVAYWNSSSLYTTLENASIDFTLLDLALLNVQIELTALLKKL